MIVGTFDQRTTSNVEILPDYLGVAEIARGGTIRAAECDGADLALLARQDNINSVGSSIWKR
jgi:hypothetical protein